jgi:hypothetical protein
LDFGLTLRILDFGFWILDFWGILQTPCVCKNLKDAPRSLYAPQARQSKIPEQGTIAQGFWILDLLGTQQACKVQKQSKI